MDDVGGGGGSICAAALARSSASLIEPRVDDDDEAAAPVLLLFGPGKQIWNDMSLKVQDVGQKYFSTEKKKNRQEWIISKQDKFDET